MKQLVFDTTDATSIADSDSVGAFLRSSDGTLITHTTVGGKEALDVRIAEGINVEVDLDAADDSVASHLFDGAGTALTSTLLNGTDQSLDVNIANATVTVDATDLDIRDLDSASDSVAAVQSGTWTIDSITNPVTVTATDLDIRDLDAAQDSVASHLFDGAGTALTSTLVGADQALDVNVVQATGSDDALADTAIANAAATLAVAGTAQDAVASPLADRKYLFINNRDNKNIFIGSTGVTAANGFPLSPSATIELRAGASIDIEFVGQSGATPEIRTLELS